MRFDWTEETNINGHWIKFDISCTLDRYAQLLMRRLHSSCLVTALYLVEDEDEEAAASSVCTEHSFVTPKPRSRLPLADVVEPSSVRLQEKSIFL